MGGASGCVVSGGRGAAARRRGAPGCPWGQRSGAQHAGRWQRSASSSSAAAKVCQHGGHGVVGARGRRRGRQQVLHQVICRQGRGGEGGIQVGVGWSAALGGLIAMETPPPAPLPAAHAHLRWSAGATWAARPAPRGAPPPAQPGWSCRQAAQEAGRQLRPQFRSSAPPAAALAAGWMGSSTCRGCAHLKVLVRRMGLPSGPILSALPPVVGTAGQTQQAADEQNRQIEAMLAEASTARCSARPQRQLTWWSPAGCAGAGACRCHARQLRQG